MRRFLNFLKYLIPFAVISYFAQYFVASALFPDTTYFYPLWSVYLFMFLATIISYLILLFVNENFSDYTGYTFMGLGIFKMLAAVVFFVPLIRSETENRIPDVAMFFIAYFLFLGFETYKAIRLLK